MLALTASGSSIASTFLFETVEGVTGKRRRFIGEISSTATAVFPGLVTEDFVLKLLRNARTSDTNGTTERYRPIDSILGEMGQ